MKRTTSELVLKAAKSWISHRDEIRSVVSQLNKCEEVEDWELTRRLISEDNAEG
jgi:hypothetical protein